jgi:hypothetical protein
MDFPDIKWRRISPGWYQAELQSPMGTTRLSIERQTKFKIYHCRIDYPDGTRWTGDRDSLDMARFACEWQLNEDVESKLGWKKTDDTEMIQRVSIHPGSEASVGPVVDALKSLGFTESEIRVLRLGKGDSIDRILAYKDDSVDGPPGRLDFERSSDLFEAIWSRVGYVRIQLDLFRKGGESISGPSLFEWLDARKADG